MQLLVRGLEQQPVKVDTGAHDLVDQLVARLAVGSADPAATAFPGLGGDEMGPSGEILAPRERVTLSCRKAGSTTQWRNSSALRLVCLSTDV